MPPLEHFKYSSLDQNDPYAFRLLRIVPAHESAPVEVVLVHESRPSTAAPVNAGCPPYRALSYTWGDNSSKVPISVNNKSLLITSNLDAALRDLRRIPEQQQEYEFFWIDAISIDQTEISERNDQVAQMLEIYANAREVIIWLGPATPLTGIAINFVEMIWELFADRAGAISEHNKPGPYGVGNKSLISKIIDQVACNYDIEWQAIVELLERPWWKRSWVIQELACASVATFLWGKHCLSWDKISVLIMILFARNPKLAKHSIIKELHKPGRDELPRAARLYSIRWSFQSKRMVGLGELNSNSLLICGYDYLAYQAQLTDCGDPLDKVYAFLGLASADFRSLFKPDYSQSVARTYSMVIKVNYLCYDNLNILRRIKDGLSHKYLPSWTIDLNDNLKRETHGMLYGNAAGSWSTKVLRPLKFSEDLQCMEVDGFTVDIIQDSKFQGTDVVFQAYASTKSKIDLVESLLIKLLKFEVRDDLQTRKRIQTVIYNVLTAATGWCSNTTRHERLRIEYPERLSSAEALQPKNIEAIFHEVDRWISCRTLTFSKKRYLGLAPGSTRPGDHICIIFGLGFPAILRPRQDGAWSFVGTAYVHGLMDGEAVREFDGLAPPESLVTRYKLR